MAPWAFVPGSASQLSKMGVGAWGHVPPPRPNFLLFSYSSWNNLVE